VLSGGERVRVALARLLLQPINLLLLDEPTNHLDIVSTEALARALEQFRGTLIAVSHDRAFLRRLVTGVLEVDLGGARLYPGDFSYYEWKRGNEDDGAPARATPRRKGRGRTKKNPEVRSQAVREDRVLAELEALEEQRTQLEADLAREDTWRNGEAMRELKRSLVRNRERERELTSSLSSD
jgi:ATP-binding cassette subfamily F protein 3